MVPKLDKGNSWGAKMDLLKYLYVFWDIYNFLYI